MNLPVVDHQTKILVEQGHKVFQAHRFANDECSHVSRLARWAEFPANAKVIDLGCGTGEVAKIMKSLRPDLDFCLVNISQFQLDYCPSFTRHCCDFCDVPEASNSFDAAMFCFSIGHSDASAAMQEAARLLKVGGVLFIYDMVRESGDNGIMELVSYQVNRRAAMQCAAVGFRLDFYMEPQDDGNYGRAVLGDDFETVFGGTRPAIWRFVKA